MNKLSKFWQELKRRNVVRRNTVYAGAAFVILELVSIVQDPLKLPEWTLTFLIVLLSVGFIVSIVISWIYDFNPDGGFEKTKPAQQDETIHESASKSSSWKIASLLSFVVIVVLIILNLIPRSNHKKGRGLPDRSIAVIPFRNDSPGEEKMYFINGTMEEILDNLSEIENLRVVSRTTVEQYRENPKPVSVIAEEMDVGYVLEGSGQREGDRVRITVQLLDGSDTHIWSESFVREIEDVFDLQKEVARLVTSDLEQAISERAIRKSKDLSIESRIGEAFYQKGSEMMSVYWQDTYKMNPLDKAEDLFRYALEYDPTLHQAYHQLATVYNMRYWRTENRVETLDSLLIMTERALKYDDQNPAYYNLNASAHERRGQPEMALASYNKALALDPQSQEALVGILDLQRNRGENIKALEVYRRIHEKGINSVRVFNILFWMLADNGFNEVAQQFLEEAFELDRDTIDYYHRLGRLESLNGNFPDATEYYLQSYAMDSLNSINLASLGINYMFDGQFNQSMVFYKKYIESIGPTATPIFPHWLGYVYTENGETAQGERYISTHFESLKENLGRSFNLRATHRELASIYALLGENEKAMEHLRALAKQDGINRFDILLLKALPHYNNIRNEPEFREIMEELETIYREKHDEIGRWLEENNML